MVAVDVFVLVHLSRCCFIILLFLWYNGGFVAVVDDTPLSLFLVNVCYDFRC